MKGKGGASPLLQLQGGRVAASITREGSTWLISSVILWSLPLWKEDPLFKQDFVCKLPPPAWRMQKGHPRDALRMQVCELGGHQRGQLAVLEAERVWGAVPGPHYCLVIAPGASSGGTTWLPDDAPGLSLRLDAPGSTVPKSLCFGALAGSPNHLKGTRAGAHGCLSQRRRKVGA